MNARHELSRRPQDREMKSAREMKSLRWQCGWDFSDLAAPVLPLVLKTPTGLQPDPAPLPKAGVVWRFVHGHIIIIIQLKNKSRALKVCVTQQRNTVSSFDQQFKREQYRAQGQKFGHFIENRQTKAVLSAQSREAVASRLLL